MRQRGLSGIDRRQLILTAAAFGGGSALGAALPAWAQTASPGIAPAMLASAVTGAKPKMGDNATVRV